MDPVMRRINELARRLACDRQAVSIRTAEGLVSDIARTEGVGTLPDQVLAVLAAELCELVEKHWAPEAGGKKRDNIA